MLASVVAAYDRLLVWLGARSRHASRATAATPREYRGRHATNTLARDLADAVAAGAITVNQARQNMPDPHLAASERIEPQADGSIVAPVAGLYKVTGPTFRGGYPAGNKGLSLMAPPPASMSKPRPPATDQPRPGSLTAEKVAKLYNVPADVAAMLNTLRSIREENDRSLSEFGQRIADNLTPWFDKVADTITMPIFQADWRELSPEQRMREYGRADKL